MISYFSLKWNICGTFLVSFFCTMVLACSGWFCEKPLILPQIKDLLLMDFSGGPFFLIDNLNPIELDERQKTQDQLEAFRIFRSCFPSKNPFANGVIL